MRYHLIIQRCQSSPGFLQDLLIQLLLESSSGSEDETGHVETWTRPGLLLLLYYYHDDIIMNNVNGRGLALETID